MNDDKLKVEVEFKEEPFEGDSFKDTLVEDTIAMSKSDIIDVLKKASETQEFRPTGHGMDLVSAHNYDINAQPIADLPIEQLRDILTQTTNKDDRKFLKQIIKQKKAK